jgi:hypothetical protein
MGKAADWLREERRKTLGDWVPHGGTHGSPVGPLLQASAPTCSIKAPAGQSPAPPRGSLSWPIKEDEGG